MVTHSLEVNKDFFHPKENNEELFAPKVLYFSEIEGIDIYGKLYKIRYIFFYEFTRKI